MKRFKTFFSCLIFTGIYVNLNAQQVTQTKQQIMLEQGKINVVVVVYAIILIGIFSYLFYLDKKINNLKK